MKNYCVDYLYRKGDYCEGDTFIFDSHEERQAWVDKAEEGYTVLDVYENEDCYCHAYYEGECACGNFK